MDLERSPNKLTIQCQTKTGRAREFNLIVQPAAIKAINISDPSFWSAIASENPGVLRVIRRHPNIEGWLEEPETTAIKNVQAYALGFGHLLDSGQGWLIEDNNEWVHSHECDRFDPADRYMAAHIDEVHRRWQGRVHVCSLNAAPGHYSDIRWEHCLNTIEVFPRTLQRLNECPDCLLCSHEYDHPTMWRLYLEGLAKGDGGMWLILKFLRIQRKLDEMGLHNVNQAITEFGIDSGISYQYPSRGWRDLHPDINEARKLFLRCLHPYYDSIMRHPRLKFAAAFGYGMDPDWDSFNLDPELVQAISRFKLFPEVRPWS